MHCPIEVGTDLNTESPSQSMSTAHDPLPFTAYNSDTSRPSAIVNQSTDQGVKPATQTCETMMSVLRLEGSVAVAIQLVGE